MTWWSPDPRGIFDMIRFSPAKRLLRKMRQGLYSFTRDRAFEQVIRACAEPRMDQSGSWLGPKLIEAYIHLHRLGHAHSVECWREGELVGGIYGVTCGGLFAGESMFSRVSEASKLALLSLVEILRERQFGLLDIQWVTDHLEMFGAVEVRRAVYLRMLQEAIAQDCVFHAPGEWPMWNRIASRERELAV